MAKSTRSNGRHKSQNGSRNGSRHIFEDVLALAETLAKNRKELGADKLRSLASSTREFAATMTDMPHLRGYVASAAESVEGLSDYVLHTDIEHMAGDAETFARRHPAATLAITMAAGMAAGVLLRRQPADIKTESRRGAGISRKATRGKRAAQARRGTNGKAQAHA